MYKTIILRFVLYECETWSFTVTEELKIVVRENTPVRIHSDWMMTAMWVWYYRVSHLTWNPPLCFVSVILQSVPLNVEPAILLMWVLYYRVSHVTWNPPLC
jgi:hypothetical protein